MGIIKAALNSISQGLGEQWKEVIEADNMSKQTVFTKGVAVRTDGSNTRGSSDIVTNGSRIHVYPGQFMMLVDGGKVVDYTAEEGYYTINNSSAPSLFNGQFGDALKDVFGRIAYGGTNPQKQQVFFINLQEITGLKYGTQSPIEYYDRKFDMNVRMRCFGEYSIKVTNPLLFYEQVIPKNTNRVLFTDVNSQYQTEFMQALSVSIAKLSGKGFQYFEVTEHLDELGEYMRTALDDDWNQTRGFEIDHVSINPPTLTEETQKLIDKRSEGAALKDANIREGYVQGAIAEGLKAAGSNTAGAAQAFMGMGMGMNAAGNFMGAASATNAQQMQQQAQLQAQQMQMQQMQMQQEAAQQAEMQAKQQAAAAAEAAAAAAAGEWVCECGTKSTGKFCPGCGKAKPEAPKAPEGAQWFCPQCGTKNTGNFCISCGTKRPSGF